MPGYKSRNSLKHRREVLALQDYYRALQARRERLINFLFFNESLVLVSIWLRIFYVLFFCWIEFLNGQPGGTRIETVQVCTAYIQKTSRGKNTSTFVLNFQTNFGSYQARQEFKPIPYPRIGDSLEITYTLFGKPAAFKALNSKDSFDLWHNWVPILLVGFLTLASFAAFQGYDYTTNIVIAVACIADVITIAYYFLYC